MYFLSISGPDGAGKSTLARAISMKLRTSHPNVDINYLWLRWNPRAQSGSPALVSSTVDPRHRGHVAKRFLRRLGMKRLWVALATNSYRRQLRLQLASVHADSILIADRYVLDFVADLVEA